MEDKQVEIAQENKPAEKPKLPAFFKIIIILGLIGACFNLIKGTIMFINFYYKLKISIDFHFLFIYISNVLWIIIYVYILKGYKIALNAFIIFSIIVMGYSIYIYFAIIKVISLSSLIEGFGMVIICILVILYALLDKRIRAHCSK